MKLKKVITVILTITIVSTAFMACGGEKSADIPFTTLGFESTHVEMTEELGEPIEEKPSVFGTAYSYPCEYKDQEGVVQYIFDEDGKMTSVRWSYACEEGDDITNLYTDIHKQLENKYGETKESTESVTNLSDIWRLDTGNIEVAAIVSSDLNVIMYTYLSPENSTSAEELENK